MIKDFLWDHFEKTGEINSYLCFREYDLTGKCEENDTNSEDN